MKKTITEDDFMEEVQKWETRRDHFTPEGWRAIYRYIDESDEEIEGDTELDIVALCCELSEYDSASDAIAEYTDKGPAYWTDDLPDGTREDLAREWFEDRTTVIPVGDTGRIIIVQF